MKIPSQPTPTSSQPDTNRERPQSTIIETPKPAPSSSGDRTLLRIPLRELPLVVQNTVPIEQLKQPVGQQIIARVIGQLKGENLIAGKDVDLPKEANTAKQGAMDALKQSPAQPSSSAPIAIEGPAKQITSEILLKVGSQYLLTATKAPVASNDLIAVVINENKTLSIVPKPLTRVEQQASLLQTIRTVLSQTLPQQVSLKTGLNILNEIAAKQVAPPPLTSNVGQAAPTPALEALASSKVQTLAKFAALMIAEQLPTSEMLAKPFNRSSEFSAQTTSPNQLNPAPFNGDKNSSLDQALIRETNALIKAWLNNSGVSFESKLMGNNNAAHASQMVQRQLSQIWKVVSQTADATEEMTTRANEPQTNAGASKRSVSNQQLWLDAAKYALTNTKAETTPPLIKNAVEMTALQKKPELWQPVSTQIERFNTSINKTFGEANTLLKLFETVSNAPTLQFNSRILKSLAQSLGTLNTQSEAAVTSLNKLSEISASRSRLNMSVAGLQQPSSSTAIDAAVEALNQQVVAAKNHPILMRHQGTQDLKAILQQAIINIAATDPNVQPKAGPEGLLSKAISGLSTPSNKPEIVGLLEPNLLKQPFDFPRMDTSILKAQALMADQELSTGQLLKLMAAMINRIQFNQANSLYQAQTAPDQSVAQSWNIELPYVHANQTQTIQVRIDQRNGREQAKEQDDQSKKKQWTIQLAFNLELIGPMHIQAELSPPTVTAQVWVANKDVKKLIEREQSKLVDRLEQAGLQVEAPKCHIGKPSQDVEARIKQGLVDTRA